MRTTKGVDFKYLSIDISVLLVYTIYEAGKRVFIMSISYKPLWKTLIDQDMTKKMLMETTGISKSTIIKMNKGEFVSLEIINRICEKLHCNISDVMVYVEE